MGSVFRLIKYSTNVKSTHYKIVVIITPDKNQIERIIIIKYFHKNIP